MKTPEQYVIRNNLIQYVILELEIKTSDVVLVPLLLTLRRFHRLFWYFHC